VQATIPNLFRQAVDEVADQTWLFAEGTALTYAEALRRIERVASWCRAAGVGPGDRVLVTARNTPDYLLTWLGLMEVGAVEVPINPSSSPAEIAGFVGQVDPKVIVTDSGLLDPVVTAAQGTASAALIVDVGELFTAEADGRGPSDVEPDAVAVMIPTSGTTGRSKLVMQTHVAYVMAGEGFPFWMQLTADDRLMTSLPLFHINAPAYSTLGSVAARASLVLLPGFSAGGFLHAARRYQATEFNAIGAMLEILMRQPERPDDADNPLRRCYTGPSPDRERQEAIERRFGIEIVCGYGLSESTYGLIWPRGSRPFATLGAARQHPQLGHVNDARVREAGADGVGELELRNPAIMRGYYEMPDETAAVLVDGWLRTGDLVTDNGDGTFTFVGRQKEVIRRRGENLSPTEVEAVLEHHPDVAEVAVIGVASQLSEEDVKAFLVPVAGHEIDLVGLDAFARERLARFKVPRYYEVVTELPYTPTGRLAKHRLPVERSAAELDIENGAHPV
jgi:crotonobetaine/carnitine-CoA ligase